MAMTVDGGNGMPTVFTGGSNDMLGGGNGWGILLGLLFGRMFGWGGPNGTGAADAAVTASGQNFSRLENGQQFIRESISGVNDNLTGYTFQLSNGINAVGQNLSNQSFGLNNAIRDVGFALSNQSCTLGDTMRDVGTALGAQINGVNNTLQSTSCATNLNLKDGFYGTSNAITNASFANTTQLNALSRQMAECCCETNRSIDAVNNNITAAVCSIGNMFKDAELREAYAKISEQGTALSEQRIVNTITSNLQPPRPMPSYVVGNPYTGQTQCFC